MQYTGAEQFSTLSNIIKQILKINIFFGLRYLFKGIVSPDWKGLQMISLDRFEV
jgi:hypothetical protein